MKRIAIFLPSLHGGGAERAMVNFAGELAQRDFNVDLVVAQLQGALREVLPRGVEVLDLGCRRMVTALPGLVRYLRNRSPDALYATITHANILAALASRCVRPRPRTVLRQSNAPLSEPRTSLGRLLSLWLIAPTYQMADGVIAVSGGVAEQLFELDPNLARKVRVIPTPVISLEVLSRGEDTIDHPWFAPGSPPVVLGAGRLKRHKGFGALINAFEQVLLRRDARLIIIGEGSDRKEFEQQVEAKGLQGYVDLPGFTHNPFAFMNRAAAFVLSSEYEGLPNVLIQAMAFGTPVVSTDCQSGPAEILEDGRLGRLVPVGDVPRMADAIEAALGQPKRDDVRESVLSRFGVAQAASSYLDFAGLTVRCDEKPSANPYRIRNGR